MSGSNRSPARPLLAPGDTVGVVSPGFAVRKDLLERGLREIRRLGFAVALGPSALGRSGYFAGDDAARAADLSAMLEDQRIRGVWFARGGFGTARLLGTVDLPAVARDPKPLIGYSDLTALFAALSQIRRQVCLYGPVASEMGDSRSHHRASLLALLSGRPVTLRFPPGRALRHGCAEGRLAGGNLTVLTHLLGTPHFPDLRGKILFLEDTPEPVYRLDRMLTHLRMSGRLGGVAAVLVGSLAPAPRERRFPPDRDVADLLRETLLPLGVPVVAGLPAGHLPGKWTLPLGGWATLDTRVGRVALSTAAPR